jgi:hypothetical protein
MGKVKMEVEKLKKIKHQNIVRYVDFSVNEQSEEV